MSRQVEQHSLIGEEANEGEGAQNAAAVQALEEQTQAKPAIVIKSSDLQLVMDSTCLSRQEAIDLIQKAEGNIKQALVNYLQ